MEAPGRGPQRSAQRRRRRKKSALRCPAPVLGLRARAWSTRRGSQGLRWRLSPTAPLATMFAAQTLRDSSGSSLFLADAKRRWIVQTPRPLHGCLPLREVSNPGLRRSACSLYVLTRGSRRIDFSKRGRHGRPDRHHGEIQPSQRRSRRRRFLRGYPSGRGSFARLARAGRRCAPVIVAPPIAGSGSPSAAHRHHPGALAGPPPSPARRAKATLPAVRSARVTASN